MRKTIPAFFILLMLLAGLPVSTMSATYEENEAAELYNRAGKLYQNGSFKEAHGIFKPSL